MNASVWRRWSPLAAVVYAVAYVIGLILLIGEEIDDKTDSGILDYYADGGNRSEDFIGLILVAIGLVFFLVFVSVLRERLRSNDAGADGLSGFIGAAGVAATAMFLAGSAAGSAMSVAADYIDDFTVNPDTARLLIAFAYALILGAVFFSCGLVLATSAFAFNGRVLPAWIGWLGIPVVILALVEAFLFPLFVIPAWSLIVGITLFIRAPRE